MQVHTTTFDRTEHSQFFTHIFLEKSVVAVSQPTVANNLAFLLVTLGMAKNLRITNPLQSLQFRYTCSISCDLLKIHVKVRTNQYFQRVYIILAPNLR